MPELNVTCSNGVMRLQFNRPAVLNALSPNMLNALIEACDDIGKDESVRVVLLEGSGEHFSTGADLPAFHECMVSDPLPSADLGRRATEAVAALPQITIAAIRGYCIMKCCWGSRMNTVPSPRHRNLLSLRNATVT